MDCESGMISSETQRIQVLESFAVLDTPAERNFDDLTELAAELCEVPVSLVTLVDADRQWFKSRRGIDATSTPRDESFCVHVLDSTDVVEIPDARQDARVAHYDCVRGEPGFRFYAGAPLRTADGHGLGTLCVADYEPRRLSDTQRRQLTVLAAQVMAQLEVRRQAIALQAALEEARTSRRMLEGVLNHTDVLTYAKDLDGKYVMVNPAVTQATGVTEDMIGHSDAELFSAEIAAEYRRNDEKIIKTVEHQVFTERLMHGDGSHRTYRSTKFPVRDDAGDVIGIAGVSTDITDVEAERAALEDAEMRLRTLVEASPVAIAVTDEAGVLIYVNPAAVQLCAVPSIDDLHGRSALELVAPGQQDALASTLAAFAARETDSTSGRSVLQRGDGITLHVEYTINRIKYAGQNAFQVQVRDVTDAIADQQNLLQIANTDALTNVMNRRAWIAHLMPLLDEPCVTAGELVIAMIDIDHFKAFNDSSGHLAGDRLLRQIADTITTNVRSSDLVARWGGEEFLVALPEITVAQAVSVLERIRCSMPSDQTCSIGYTAWRPGETIEECISRADRAMYAAKNGGRNRTHDCPASPHIRSHGRVVDVDQSAS